MVELRWLRLLLEGIVRSQLQYLIAALTSMPKTKMVKLLSTLPWSKVMLM
jgi:hypothetical protein